MWPYVNIINVTQILNPTFRVLELIQEAKWLVRLGVQIPESARQILRQEGRFKSYRDHLRLCLSQFQSVQDSIPPGLSGLFSTHVEHVLEFFQPGLSTLSWSSMNIGRW